MPTSTFNNPQSFGAFGPTTNVWDVGEIYEIHGLDPKLQEVLVRLYQNLNLMALLLNIKDSGFYNTDEFVNGQIFFPNQATPVSTFDTADSIFRQVYRQVINFGPLPNAGTKSVPHNITITNQTSFTRIYGAASDQTGLNYIPLPYASPTLANNIELNANATNVNVITGSNRSNFTVSYIILEYLQS